jgi:hypothetical protein
MLALGKNSEQNYHQFFEDAINTGCVWALQGGDGWALCASEQYAQAEVIPFWSQPEFAQCHIKGDWQHYEVVPIALEEFMDDWLTGMHKDIVLAGINWNKNLEGEEYEPLDILHMFENEYLS